LSLQIEKLRLPNVEVDSGIDSLILDEKYGKQLELKKKRNA